ncbi:unnamed protein product [marine sediment metagenome]|uniref:Uncharacterized protein n=1 Tax=marine sediment metagenome TaxID=412755 RepID=X1J7E3_9ZZZZ
MEKEKFEAIVLNTLKNIPDKFKDKIKNLSIVIEEKDIRPVLKDKKMSAQNTHLVFIKDFLPPNGQAE